MDDDVDFIPRFSLAGCLKTMKSADFRNFVITVGMIALMIGTMK